MQIFNKTPRSVEAIVADFDKTLTELQKRQEHDQAEIDAAQAEEQRLIAEHNARLAELATKRADHQISKERAVRVHGKISDLLK